jgi:hypothetical protein
VSAPPIFLWRKMLKADRVMLYFESAETNWITLRLACFHYTLFKTDVLDILEVTDVDVPPWLEYIISRAQRLESRPIPNAPFPQSLPSLNTIRNAIPSIIEPGMSYPTWGGTQLAGLVINPGGEVDMTEIPYKAKLRTGSFLGLNFWIQSGMLNGAACLVSQALLYYQRVTEEPANYPLIDLSGYVEGQLEYGAKIWHIPGLADTDSHATESGWAHNYIRFYPGSGYYDVDRWFYADCPIPEYPNEHFMRPAPGMRLKISAVRGTLGRFRCLLEDDYQLGESLDTVPFGCQPGWPDDTYLAQYGLYNNDNVGLYSLADIVALPTPGYIWEHAITEADGYHEVVWEEEPREGSIYPAFPAGAMSLMSMWLKKKVRVVRSDDWVNRANTSDGEPDTIAGQAEEE